MTDEIPRPLADVRPVAIQWLGTPFAANVAVMGAGVSCHMLPFAIYRELHWLPSGLVAPRGAPSHARWRGDSIITPWVDGSQYFRALDLNAGQVQPGDLLGYKVREIIHHVGVMLDGGEFIHCLEPMGTVLHGFDDPTYLGRLARIWRPVAVSQL